MKQNWIGINKIKCKKSTWIIDIKAWTMAAWTYKRRSTMRDMTDWKGEIPPNQKERTNGYVCGRLNEKYYYIFKYIYRNIEMKWINSKFQKKKLM